MRLRVSDIIKQERREKKKEELRQERLRLSERGRDDPRSPAFSGSDSPSEGTYTQTQLSDSGRPRYPASGESSVSDSSSSKSKRSDVSNHIMSSRRSIEGSEYESEYESESESDSEIQTELCEPDMGGPSSDSHNSSTSGEMSTEGPISGLDRIKSHPVYRVYCEEGTLTEDQDTQFDGDSEDGHTTTAFTGYSGTSTPMGRSQRMEIAPRQEDHDSVYSGGIQSPRPPGQKKPGRIRIMLENGFERVAEALGGGVRR